MDTKTTQQEIFEAIILGAGICGLTVAEALMRTGHKSWTVLDKGRSVGGRLATRRIDGQKFDHGAQFFTVRSQLFRQKVDAWLRNGVVREWVKGFNQHACGEGAAHQHRHTTTQKVEDGHSRYIGVGGMNQIAKHIASGMSPDHLMLNRRITQLKLQSDGLVLKAEDGFELIAKTLVMTTPLPQTLELLKASNGEFDTDSISSALSSVTYDPCIALMGFFDVTELPLDTLPLQCPNDVIAFLSDNYSKGLAAATGALTVHLSPEASRGMFTAHDSVIADFTCHQLKQLFGLKKVTRPSSFEIQRWRYAAPQVTLDKPFLELKLSNAGGSRIIFAGEAFGGPKIEGAFLSGHAVAHRLLALEM